MAIELATAYVSIVPSARGIKAALQREIGGGAAGVSRLVGDRMGRDIGSRISSGISRSMKVGALAGGAALVAAGGAGLKLAADFQQTTTAFEGLLGSSSKAQALIGDLRTFAKKTPFEFTGLSKSARQLLGVGFAAEDIVPTLTDLGNVAATLGVGDVEIQGVVRALGQMKGKGKVAAQELLQISEQIPGFSAVDALAKGLGKTVPETFELMGKGAVPAKEGIDAILAGMRTFPGAAGAMERQSKTLNGVLSNLKDTVAIAAIDFITPALPAITAGVNWIVEKLPAAVNLAGKAFGWLGRVISPVVGFIRDNLVPVLAYLGVIVAALIGPSILGGLLVVASAVSTAFAFLTGPIGLVAALVAGVVYAYQHFEGFRNVVDNVAASIRDGLGAALNWITQTAIPWLRDGWAELVSAFQSGDGDGLFGSVGEVARAFVDWFIGDAIPAIKGAWSDLTASLKGGEANGIFGGIGRQLRSVYDWITGTAIPGIKQAVDSFMAGLRGVGDERSFFADLGEAAAALAGWFQTTLLPAAQRLFRYLTTDGKPILIGLGIGLLALTSPITLVVGGFIYLYQRFEGFRAGVATILGLIRGYFRNIWLPTFLFAWSTAKTYIGLVAAYIRNVLVPAFNFVVAVVKKVWPVVEAVIRQAWRTMSTIFNAIRTVITTVVIPHFNRVRAVASFVFSVVSAVVRDAWNIIRPIFSAVVGYVRDTLIPRFQAFMRVSQTVFTAVKAAVSGAWNRVRPIFESIIRFVSDRLVPVWSGISRAVGSAFDALPRIIQRALRSAGNVIAGFLRGAAGIADKIGLDSIAKALRGGASSADGWGEGGVPGASRGGRGGRQATSYGMASGGRVTGGIPGKDSVLLRGMPGEVMIRKSSVDKFGTDNLLALNSGRVPAGWDVPGYASGGVLLQAGRRLEAAGARIGEHPAWDRVDRVHANNSRHYTNASGTGADAFDANFGAGSSAREMRFFDAWAPMIRDMGLNVLWRVKDHFNHMHVDIGGKGVGGGSNKSVWDRVSDAVSGALRDVAAGGLERIWPAMPGAPGLKGLIPGGANYMRKGIIDFIKGKAAEKEQTSSASAAGPVMAGSNRSIGQRLAAARGWTGGQWGALDQLFQNESGWNHRADNPSSSAYGIPQSLPGSKMASAGSDWRTNPATQITWGLNYIAERYGSPSAALAAWTGRSPHWYAQGGVVKDMARKGIVPGFADGAVVRQPTLAALGDGTGRLRTEIVTPEALMRQVVRDETADKGGGVQIGEVNVYEPVGLKQVMQELSVAVAAGRI